MISPFASLLILDDFKDSSFPPPSKKTKTTIEVKKGTKQGEQGVMKKQARQPGEDQAKQSRCEKAYLLCVNCIPDNQYHIPSAWHSDLFLVPLAMHMFSGKKTQLYY